jgi:hypothetical protein
MFRQVTAINRCSWFPQKLLKQSIVDVYGLRPVQSDQFFILGDSPATEFYVPTFRNSVPS